MPLKAQVTEMHRRYIKNKFDRKAIAAKPGDIILVLGTYIVEEEK